MTNQLSHTSVVSNGFITEVDYHQLEIEAKITEYGYICPHRVGGRLSAISQGSFTAFILNSSLQTCEREDVKSEWERGVLYIFTPLVGLAEKIDGFISAFRMNLSANLLANASALQLVSETELNDLLQTPDAIEFEGEMLGQLEWLEYASYCVGRANYLEAINAYNNYYLETGDAKVGYNLGVLLSSINLDRQALGYYLQLANPTDQELHNIAYSYFKLQKYQTAYEYIVRVDLSNSLKSHLIKSQIEIKLGELRLALNSLNQGFIATKAISPKDAKAIKKQFNSLLAYIQVNNS